jgi:hypothetical protein
MLLLNGLHWRLLLHKWVLIGGTYGVLLKQMMTLYGSGVCRRLFFFSRLLFLYAIVEGEVSI